MLRFSCTFTFYFLRFCFLKLNGWISFSFKFHRVVWEKRSKKITCISWSFFFHWWLNEMGFSFNESTEIALFLLESITLDRFTIAMLHLFYSARKKKHQQQTRPTMFIKQNHLVFLVNSSKLIINVLHDQLIVHSIDISFVSMFQLQ